MGFPLNALTETIYTLDLGNGLYGTVLPDISGQLPEGYYSPARLPFMWTNPNGSETERSTLLYAHSEFNYKHNYCVTGGSPPYMFYLTNPVAGVTVTRRAPQNNPNLYLWAEVEIDRTSFGGQPKSFEINCRDQNGSVISLPMTVTQNDLKFVFMQQGAIGGDGTFNSPYSNLIDIFTTNSSDAAHAGKLIVAMSGTYNASNFDTAFTALQINYNKPVGWMPFPGETVNIIPTANMVIGEPIGGPFTDYYFGNVTYSGGDTSAANLRIFAGFGEHDRIIFDRPRFVDIGQGTSGADNEACIYFSNSTEFGIHRDITVIDPYYENLVGSANGVAFIDLYATNRVTVLGGTARNCNNNFGVWPKVKNENLMVVGFDVYDTVGQTVNRAFFLNNGDAGLSTPISTVQFLACKGFRATDGIFSDTTLLIGDSNQQWGIAYFDRMTIVGAVRDGGDDAAILGTAYIEDSIIINELTTKIPAFVNSTNNVSDSRSNIALYLESDGNTLPTYAEYGKQGATFIAAEVL